MKIFSLNYKFDTSIWNSQYFYIKKIFKIFQLLFFLSINLKKKIKKNHKLKFVTLVGGSNRQILNSDPKNKNCQLPTEMMVDSKSILSRHVGNLIHEEHILELTWPKKKEEKRLNPIVSPSNPSNSDSHSHYNANWKG